MKRWLVQWFSMPSGQTHEQKKRPKMSVPVIMMRERARPLYTVQLVRKDDMEISGLSSRKSETSKPFMLRKSVIPISIRKRMKKKTDQTLLMF